MQYGSILYSTILKKKKSYIYCIISKCTPPWKQMLTAVTFKKNECLKKKGVITELNNFALHEAFRSAEETELKCHVDLHIYSKPTPCFETK